MSSRITRSSARQAASQAAQNSAIAPAAADVPTAPSATPSSRKRKGRSVEKSPSNALPTGSSGRRSKRQKIPDAISPPATNNNHQSAPRSRRKGKPAVDMDIPEYVSNATQLRLNHGIHVLTHSSNDRPGSANAAEPSVSSSSSSRKSSRSKKVPGPPQGSCDKQKLQISFRAQN
jgi:E3 ubiquitin-protein ligase TRIP12